MKSLTCFRKDGESKTVYFMQEEAQGAAEYVSQGNGLSFSPYQCHDCGNWHICPSDMQTPNKQCHYCTGGNGKSKALYESYAAARKRADIIYQERNQRLDVYECPHNKGFHLTKS